MKEISKEIKERRKSKVGKFELQTERKEKQDEVKKKERKKKERGRKKESEEI